MGFRMGIVGLPNVGKSTLFNALTRTAAAQAANFPFCTIEPNVGEVAVPDARLDRLAVLAKSKQIIPTRMTFVDIAGLVKGASKGEGLGNQFLANIRECDAIAHVVRCFEDGDVTHVEGSVDPVARCRDDRDRADAGRSGRRRAAAGEPRPQGARRRQGGGGAGAAAGPRQAALEQGGRRGRSRLPRTRRKAWRMLQLLTAKPVLYVLQRFRGRGGDRQRRRPRGWRQDGGRRGGGDGGDLGPDRGGDRPASGRGRGAVSRRDGA